MEVLEAISTRRAIRQYKKDPVPPELIEKLLEAGRWAPSSTNSQPWEFIVITDPETKRKISRAFVIGSFLTEAPLAIAVVVNPWRTACPVQDGAIAAYAIWLAAHGLGLGACWINPNISGIIKKILGIPVTKRLITVLAIGYPDEVPIHKRNKLQDFVYFEKHGNKESTISFKEQIGSNDKV
jgi:nitroreductase